MGRALGALWEADRGSPGGAVQSRGSLGLCSANFPGTDLGVMPRWLTP